MTKYKVAKLKKALKDANEAARIARIEYHNALCGHMAEVLDRDIGLIRSYNFERWKYAHRHYKQILKGDSK